MLVINQERTGELNYMFHNRNDNFRPGENGKTSQISYNRDSMNGNMGTLNN